MNDKNSVKQEENRDVPRPESAIIPELKACREYKTHPEQEVLRLNDLTLLRFIKDVEERHFRTEHDTGASWNAIFIWNGVRRLAGLPEIKTTDLPAYCVTCNNHHQYPHKRLPVTSEQKG